MFEYTPGVVRCAYGKRHLESEAIVGSFWGIRSLRAINPLASVFILPRVYSLNYCVCRLYTAKAPGQGSSGD